MAHEPSRLIIATRTDDDAAVAIKQTLESRLVGSVAVLDLFELVLAGRRMRLTVGPQARPVFDLADGKRFRRMTADCVWLRVAHYEDLLGSNVVAGDRSYVLSEAVAIGEAVLHSMTARTLNVPSPGLLLSEWWTPLQLDYCCSVHGIGRATAGMASPAEEGPIGKALVLGDTVLLSRDCAPPELAGRLVQLRRRLRLDVMEATFTTNWMLDRISANPDLTDWHEEWIAPFWRLVVG